MTEGGGVENALEEGQADPPAPAHWTFDLDFNFRPDWLQQNPEVGTPPPPQLPHTLAIFNDWVRSSIGTNNPPSSLSPTTLPPTNNLPLNPRPFRTIQDSELQSSLGSSRPDSNSFVIEVDELSGDGNEGGSGTGGRRVDEALAEPTTERTAAEILRQSPEARAFLGVIERYLPFILILLLKGLFDHGGGIVMFSALVITFSHTNTILKKEVSKQGKRSVPYLFMVSLNLILCITFMYYVFKTERLYPALIFLPTSLEPSTVFSLIWMVLVTDYVAKFLTIIVKVAVVCLPEQIVPFQKRGKHYLFVESSSQLYRSLLPMYPWLSYLFGAYDGTFKLLSILLSVFYLMCKAVDVVQRVRHWKVAFRKLLQPVHYGTSPTEDELVDLFCPICHDSFTAPTKLSCAHIFCEECVSTWLDRGERSCPMCRARVCDDTSWRDGSTSHFIQVF